MSTPILYKESKYLVKFWHYLIFIIPMVFEMRLIFPGVFGVIFATILRYSPIRLINTVVKKDGIKYSTAQLFNKGFIRFDRINHFKVIDFEKAFSFRDYHLYRYCKGMRVSSVKYGIEFELHDNSTIVVPTQKPNQLTTVINEQLKLPPTKNKVYA